MRVIIEENETLDVKTAADLLLFLHDKENGKEQIAEMIKNNVPSAYQLFLHIKKESFNYTVMSTMLIASEVLNDLEATITTTNNTAEQRQKTLLPYKEEIQKEATEDTSHRYYNSYRTIPYLHFDVFLLGIEMEIPKHYTFCSNNMNDIFKYIIEPVKDGKISLDNSTRQEIFDMVTKIIMSKVSICARTNSHLGTIKSHFAYISEKIIQSYLQVYAYYLEHYEEHGCDKYVSRNAYEKFYKKFNKWACSELIK